jgi:hypothetical protein
MVIVHPSIATKNNAFKPFFRKILSMNLELSNYAEKEANARLWRLNQFSSDIRPGPYIASLSNVFVIGQLIVHGAANGLRAVNLEKGTISDSFSAHSTCHQAIKEFEAECKGLRPGIYLPLHSLRACNFWHWVMESLIRVVTAQEAGFSGSCIIPAAAEKQTFVADSLDMLGVSRDRILLYDGHPWHVECLMVPEPIKATHDLRHLPGLMDILRSKLMAACPRQTLPPRRIYIAREDQILERRVVNETELVDLIKSYGFERIVMEHLSLPEQICLMSNADALVTPHGSGMVHSLFMKPGSLVIELFSNQYVNPCMLPVMDHLHHRYYMFSNHWLSPAQNGHIHADTFCIDITLKRELARQGN